MGRVMVIGASPNPARYSYQCVRALTQNHFDVVAIGIREGQVGDVKIITGRPFFTDIDQIILYVGCNIQEIYHDYIVALNPGEIIFNPGTENKEFENILEQNGIKTEIACTLVLLSINQY